MASLTDRLAGDLKEAMRAGDAVRRDEIRGLLAALKAERQAKLTRMLEKRGLLLRGEEAQLTPAQVAEVERLRAEAELAHEEELAVLQQRLKQHRQSIEGFARGGRQDLVAAEEAQVRVLQAYLPQQASDAELEQAVQAAIAETGARDARDHGKVMGLLSRRLRGRADMRAVSTRVQALLSPST